MFLCDTSDMSWKIVIVISWSTFSFYASYFSEEVENGVWFDTDIYTTMAFNIEAEQKEQSKTSLCNQEKHYFF